LKYARGAVVLAALAGSDCPTRSVLEFDAR